MKPVAVDRAEQVLGTQAHAWSKVALAWAIRILGLPRPEAQP